MPEYFIPTQIQFAREYGQASRDATECRALDLPLITTAADEYAVEMGEIVPPGASIQALQGQFLDGGVIEPLVAVGSRGGQGFPSTVPPVGSSWWLGRTAAPTVNSVNTSALFVDWDRVAIFDGACGPIITADAADADQFRGTVTYEFVRGMIGLFADDATGDVPPNTPDLIDQWLKRFRAAGEGAVQIGVLADGASPNIIQGAGQAFPRGDFNTFVVAADLGPGPGQLDAGDTANNTGARFRNHPSVFVRRTGHVRAFEGPVRFPVTYAAITNAPDPRGVGDSGVRIYTVDRAPTHSRWRLQIDSEPLDVTIVHPTGSDYRRPRDIWNNVIAPALASGAPVPTFANVVAGAARNFFQTGVFTRGRYCDIGTFVDAYDASSDKIYTLIPQTPA